PLDEAVVDLARKEAVVLDEVVAEIAGVRVANGPGSAAARAERVFDVIGIEAVDHHRPGRLDADGVAVIAAFHDSPGEFSWLNSDHRTAANVDRGRSAAERDRVFFFEARLGEGLEGGRIGPGDREL